MKRVLLDVDGVIANYIELALEVAREMHPIFHDVEHDHVDQWDIDIFLHRHLGNGHEYFPQEFWRRINEPGRIFSMRAYPDAKNLIVGLKERAEVYFVTSPTEANPTWAGERMEWLRRHFNVDRNHVVITAAKHLIQGDVFVDDKVSNVETWAMHNPDSIALLYEQNYNRQSECCADRIRSLSEIHDYLGDK